VGDGVEFLRVSERRADAVSFDVRHLQRIDVRFLIYPADEFFLPLARLARDVLLFVSVGIGCSVQYGGVDATGHAAFLEEDRDDGFTADEAITCRTTLQFVVGLLGVHRTARANSNAFELIFQWC